WRQEGDDAGDRCWSSGELRQHRRRRERAARGSCWALEVAQARRSHRTRCRSPGGSAGARGSSREHRWSRTAKQRRPTRGLGVGSTSGGGGA
ncbi:hypothetical protein CFC21_052280, partial [Triticum aestivum]